MSGEIIGQSKYFDEYAGGEEYDVVSRSERKTVIKGVAPAHSFYHDLESHVCSGSRSGSCSGSAFAGRALRCDLRVSSRSTIPTTRGSGDVTGNDQFASNKALSIENWKEFEKKFMAVSDWCWQLRSLLRQFSTIIRKHYEERRFPIGEIYEAFIRALEDSERSIFENSEDPTNEATDEKIEAYNAEVERRAVDCKDWEIPARKLSGPDVILEANGELAHSSDEATRYRYERR